MDRYNGANVMFLFKDGLFLIINRLSFNSSKHFLLSHVRILKSSSDAEWLQNGKWSVMELFLGLTCFFCKLCNTNMFTCSYIQVSHTFTITGLIAESTLKLINDVRRKIFGNPILETKVVALHYLQFTAIKNVFQWLLQLSLSL